MTKNYKERENQFNGEGINSFKQCGLNSYDLLGSIFGTQENTF